MTGESSTLEYKSLRLVQGKSEDFGDIARTCVAFANAQGGRLVIGVEDGQRHPPEGQRVKDDLLAAIPKRIYDKTHGVTIECSRETDSVNGAEYVVVHVLSTPPASTSDGKFYQRIGDACVPLTGEDLLRLLEGSRSKAWEVRLTDISADDADAALTADLLHALRNSPIVSSFVKEKSDRELLEYYFLIAGDVLTNLGVLWIGKPLHRAGLGSAPSLQCIKYDERGNKINKWCWDSHELSPSQLVNAVWEGVPDFREFYELPEGMLRRQIPAFDERVVRELLVNAIVHRPYTQRGGLFINLFPDRMEIVNPGSLPPGVTPRNILHKTVRRNEEFARLLHDLGLMEREGSGYPMMYEVLTSHARRLPLVENRADSVSVTVPRRIIKPELIDFLAKADAALQPTQRERIVLGLLAQHEALSANELCSLLALDNATALSGWLGQLVERQAVKQKGRTRGTRYYVNPQLLRRFDFPSHTTLKRIEPPRLRALLLEDLERHPLSGIGEIHARIREEISQYHIKSQLKKLIGEGRVTAEGKNRWRKYRLYE